MPVHNSEIADILAEVADLLEIKGANRFRVRAYREAATTIRTHSRRVADMVDEGEDLTQMSGIGEDMAGKIEEIVETGSLEQLEELEKEVPPTLTDLLHISGLGPKRVQRLYEEMNITDLESLEKAARNEEIRELEGFGPKIESEILDDIERRGAQEGRTLLYDAEGVAESLAEYLRHGEEVEEVVVAGSYRRRKETVGDLDVVAASDHGRKVIQYFVDYENIDDVLSEGKTRSSVILRSGMRVDLRVVPQENFGATLFYFTGSRSHNLSLRNVALDRDWKLNEYGVFDEDDEKIAGETEESLYAAFDLPYIEPELREDRGEFKAARNGNLPKLVELGDIHGDLQTHTTASDGHNSIEEMAQAAKDKGYDYLAITDHSEYVGVTQGLDENALAKHLEEVEKVDQKIDGLRLIRGVEVDILKDGSLALSDEALKQCELVVFSVHSHMDLPSEEQTDRIIRAMDNPYVHILAHPTSRRLDQRPPMDLDMERIMEAAIERGVYLELNAYPNRLDINDVYCKMAKEMGLRLAISTDSHRTSELDFMHFGVGQGRRGWLEPKDVINTRTWSELQKLLKRD